MQPNYFNKILFKLKVRTARLRQAVYRLKGLSVGDDSQIGKIYCDWPKNLSFGSSCEVRHRCSFRFNHPFKDSNQIVIGNDVFIGEGCEFNCSSSIHIGNDCLIASKCIFVDVGHFFKRDILIRNQKVSTEPIIVGEDVWLGSGCIITQGVTIGKGSVIAAGSVVVKSIPENEVWGGVPARFIKKRDL